MPGAWGRPSMPTVDLSSNTRTIPWPPAAMMKIALAHSAQEAPDKARKAYEALLVAYPDNALATEALVALLTIDYDQGRFEDLLARLPRVLASQLSQGQRMKAETLGGDAAMTLDQPEDAVGYYLSAWETAADPDRPEIFQKIEAAMRLVDTTRIKEILAQIQDPGLSQRIAKLAGELTFDRTTIGCLLPLSGPYASIGQKALRGVEMALSAFADTAVDPLAPTIRVMDTAADPDRARAGAKVLASQGAAAIVGPIATAEAAAMAAQTAQVPMIAWTQKEGVAALGDFIFRNFITPQMQVDALVSYTTGVLGLKRFAVLYPQDNYGTTFMNLFWDRVIQAGAEVVGVEAYEDDQTDFAVPIEKLVGLHYPIPDDLKDQLAVVTPMTDDAHVDFDLLFETPVPELAKLYYCLPDALPRPPGFDPDGDAESSPRFHRERDKPDPIIDFDAVFIPDGPKKAGLVVPQLAYNDVTHVQLLGTNLWHSVSLMEMSREYVQGAVFPDGFQSDSDLLQVRRFVSHFEAVYGQKPGFIEAVAYDSMRILLELLAHPAVRSRAGLRDALGQLSHYPGVTGLTAFGPDGEARKKLFLLQIQGRKLVEADFPQQTAVAPPMMPGQQPVP